MGYKEGLYVGQGVGDMVGPDGIAEGLRLGVSEGLDVVGR